MLENKYHRWYDALVAQGNDVSDYVEKHHILPRCMGGGDAKANLVSVSARKHFLLHWLLTKFTEGEALRKMRYGLKAMCNQHGEKRIFAAWQYEVAKRASRKIKLTEEEKAEISRKTRAAMARPEVKERMGGPQSEEHIAKLSSVRKGKKWSENRLKTSKDNPWKHTEEAKAKSSKSHGSLTDAQVLAIRADTRVAREIAEDYGMARSSISLIKAGLRYTFV